MAANLANINDAIAMFCVGKREDAWHQLGQRTINAATAADAMTLAHLDWQIGKKDLFVRQPITNAVFMVPDMKAVHRLNDGQYLGCVGKDYEPIQNVQAFDFMDAVLQAENGAHYESAGALGNGERIWIQARMPDADIRIKGTDDFSLGYLMVATSHDGSMSYTSKLCSTRIVCQNTLNMALGERGNAVLKVKHTKEAKARLDAASKLVTNVAMTAKTLNEKLNALATRRLNKESMFNVLNKLFPATADADNGEKVRTTKTSNVTLKVLELFESNDSNAIPEIRGTAYNLLNALTEYTDHHRNVRITDGKTGMTVEKARAEAATFGTGDAFKTDAMAAVMELTANCPINEPMQFGMPAMPAGTDWMKSLGL